MEENKTSEAIRVLFLSPGKKAEMREIEPTLESMQSQVGGMIEEYMPFDDDAAIVCNEEGKMMGLPLNRAVKDEDLKWRRNTRKSSHGRRHSCRPKTASERSLMNQKRA